MRLCKFKLGIGFDFYGLTDLLYNFIIKAMDYVKQCAANFCVMRISSFITKKRTRTGVSSVTFAGNGRPWLVFLSGGWLQRKLKVWTASVMTGCRLILIKPLFNQKKP